LGFKTYPMNLILLAVFWIAYFVLHSYLLNDSVRANLAKKLGLGEKYRFYYNIFSTVTFALVLFYYFSIPKTSLMTEESRFVTILAVVMMGGGLYLLFKTVQHYTLAEFLGLEEPEKDELITDGLYELVRHPMYFSIIIFLFGGLMYAPSYAYLVTAGIWVVYIYVGAYREEARLEKKFGKKYLKYKERTPMLIPFLKV